MNSVTRVEIMRWKDGHPREIREIKSAIVCGGRKYEDSEKVYKELDGLSHLELIINGGCSGADLIASNYAFDRGIARLVVNADWGKHGKAAGPIRNKIMLGLKPDIVVAFPGGCGTSNMVKQAREAGREVRIVK